MIEIKDLSAELGKFWLKDVNLSIQDGEYFVFLGPTGAGKTVLLECIAGLKSINSGQIKINGRDVTHLNLEKRRIGFAYQDYIVYPHLSVRDNISFGVMWKNETRQEIEDAVNRVVELLGIADLLEKRPTALSGGECQKVGLARALALKPDLLLLDEPLSSIDPEAREAAERELRELHSRLELTTIHVTHNFEEGMALGDRIAVIGNGRIVQVGTPDEIFRRPNSEFVARFVLTRNIFEGEVRDGIGEQGIFCVGEIKLGVVTTLRGRRHASIRPEDILISKEPIYSEILNNLEGVITRISDRGSLVYLTVNVPPEFTCLVFHRQLEEMALAEKQKVFLVFKASALHIF